jgi:hypothetical protein
VRFNPLHFRYTKRYSRYILLTSPGCPGLLFAMRVFVFRGLYIDGH